MRRLDRRVAMIRKTIVPPPNRAFLAYARAVVAYGGGDRASEAAVGLARWLESGRGRS